MGPKSYRNNRWRREPLSGSPSNSSELRHGPVDLQSDISLVISQPAIQTTVNQRKPYAIDVGLENLGHSNVVLHVQFNSYLGKF